MGIPIRGQRDPKAKGTSNHRPRLLVDRLTRRFWWRFHKRQVAISLIALLITSTIVGLGVRLLDERVFCERHPLVCNIASDLIVVVVIAFIGSLVFTWKLGRIVREFTSLARTQPEQLLGLPETGRLIGGAQYEQFFTGIAEDLLYEGSRRPTRSPLGSPSWGSGHTPHWTYSAEGKMVSGGAGSGKTRAAIGLTTFLAQHAAVPVLISLHGQDAPLDLIALAREQFTKRVNARTLFGDQGERVFARLRQRGQVVIVADAVERALPEGTQTEREMVLTAAIRESLQAGVPVVVTSRRLEIARKLNMASFPLPTLTSDDVYAALSLPTSVREGLDEHLQTAELTENPFYIGIAAAVAQVDQLQGWSGPNRIRLRASLLDHYVERMLDCRLATDVALSTPQREAVIDALSLIAHRMVEEGATSLFMERVRKEPWENEIWSDTDVVPAAIAMLTEDPSAVLDGGRLLGFLQTASAHSVQFHHADMQAYLASRILRGNWARMEDLAKRLRTAETATALVLAAAWQDPQESTATYKGRSRGIVKQLIGQARGDDPPSFPLCIMAAAKIAVACEVRDKRLRGSIAHASRLSWGEADSSERILMVNALRELATTAAYEQLWHAAQDPDFEVRLAAMQAMREGGEDAFRILKPAVDAAFVELAGSDEELSRKLIRTLDNFGLILPALDDSRRHHAEIKQAIRKLAEIGHPSVEIDVARGLKARAMNDRRAGPADELYRQIFDMSKFWYARICLIHAIALDSGRDNDDATVRPAREWLRSIHLNRNEHPYAAEAARQCEEALRTGTLARYVWREETDRSVQNVRRPTPHSPVEKLAPESLYLAAEVGLAMNLTFSLPATDGDDDHAATTLTKRLRVWMENSGLPHCLGRSMDRRELFKGCQETCKFNLCPLQKKTLGFFRAKFSESFCRELRDLRLPLTKRPAWQRGIRRHRGRRRFWANLATWMREDDQR